MQMIFPVPSGQGSQHISLSRLLISGSYASDANSNDMLSLDIDDLRQVATHALISIGRVPA